MSEAVHCVFCRIALGRSPADVVYQDDHVMAFRDINPDAPVHILVIPRKHITNVAAAGPADQAVLGQLLLAAAQVAAAEGVGEHFRLVTNNGRRAGQSVFHLHFHLLGGRAMGWPPG